MPGHAPGANLCVVETTTPQYCKLEKVAGRKVACPEDACAFWEPGGAVLEGRCVLTEIDFRSEPGLAEWLLEFRDALAAAPHASHAAGYEFRHARSEGKD